MKKTDTKKSALATVFLVVLVDLMGFGIVLPLLPFYAVKYDVSPVAVGFLYSIYSFAQLVCSPWWGGLSDRLGRRPIMLVSTIGSASSYLLFAFSGSFLTLFLSRLLAGVMGGNISAAQAYVADVTEHQDRAKGMGLIGAAFGIGFVLGPALSSLVIFWGESQNIQNVHMYPGLLACLLSAVSFLLVLFKLPESLRKNTDVDPSRVQKWSLFSKEFWKAISEEHNAFFRWMLLCMLLIAIGHSSLYSAFPLFCSLKLHMSAKDVGIQFVVMGVVAVLVQGGLIRVLVKKFSEKKLFVVGSILMAVGMACIPFARTPAVLALFLSVMAVGGSLNGPTLTSLISKQVSPAHMGAAMGTSQGMAALGRVIGPTWGGWLFSHSPSYPFWITSGIVLLTFLIGSLFKE